MKLIAQRGNGWIPICESLILILNLVVAADFRPFHVVLGILLDVDSPFI